MGKKSASEIPSAAHRGRIQAQGPNTEESVAWRRESPPTKNEMLVMLEQLWAKLNPSQQDERKECRTAAKAYVENAPATGIAAPFSITFRNRKMRRGVRIDIEILAGSACVDAPE